MPELGAGLPRAGGMLRAAQWPVWEEMTETLKWSFSGLVAWETTLIQRRGKKKILKHT